MRGMLACLLGLSMISQAAAQEKKPVQPAARFGITADLETYPQGSAKQALQSVAKALDRKRVEYILAHLSDPAFVDEHGQKFDGKFNDLVQEPVKHFAHTPKQTHQFRKYLTHAEEPKSAART